MNEPNRNKILLPRAIMFAVMCVLVLFTAWRVLPSGETTPGDVALNPWLQIGMFVALTIFGLLIGFWITFGDLVNRGEK